MENDKWKIKNPHNAPTLTLITQVRFDNLRIVLDYFGHAEGD